MSFRGVIDVFAEPNRAGVLDRPLLIMILRRYALARRNFCKPPDLMICVKLK